MTTRWDYWSGPDTKDRREVYAKDFTPEYQKNGDEVQRRMEAVLVAYQAMGGPDLPEGWASGWRPPAVNEATANAAKASRHLLALAGDKRDNEDGAFAWWCMAHQQVLEQHGIWLEHPVATVVRAWRQALTNGTKPTPWCHGQITPPQGDAAARRMFFPDTKSIPEWDEFIRQGGRVGMGYNEWVALQPISESGQVQGRVKPKVGP